ncbi:MAG: HAD family hydrolase [Sphingomonadales bacterium]|nr:HAD family hydrolase [Sphingomonadales bacterium]
MLDGSGFCGMIIVHPEAFARRPSCVLLDFDNTLYSYEPCNLAGMKAAATLAQRLLNLAPVDFDQCFRDARTEVKTRLGATAASHNRLLYFQRTIERAGLQASRQQHCKLEQAFWRAYMDAMELYPDALAFLNDLRIAGVPAVIVTDLTAQIQMRKLVLLGLDRVVD